ncbi:MAG: hypothetical protein B0D92_01505 [Spirochaeta sp. LUC14_002_19_P3]|nr:MAG: hypothetical protein B0D92_01505 [Spirochaeta sp. LUC14_002_19_P3]
MKIPLGAKILGAFGIIVFLALGAVVGMGNRFTHNEYYDFAVQRDMNRARAIAPFFGQWAYGAVEAIRRGREPDGSALSPLLLLGADWAGYSDRWEQMADSRDFHHHGGGYPPHRRSSQKPPPVERLLLTDANGRVLFNTVGYSGGSYLGTGTEVRYKRELVGYLYVGQMLSGAASDSETFFIRSAGIRTWVFTALVFLAAVLLGLLLTRHIVVPVKGLSAAAREVEDGTLSVRVPERRKDELGDLSRGFNSMTSSLEAADRQRRQIIANSAHELRTPVSLIRTRIEMMEEGVYPLNTENLAALARETDHLVELIEELKTLAVLESPDFTMKRDVLNLGELAASELESNRPAIARSGIEVLLRKDKGNVSVSGSTEKLRRLLKNLLANALRYAAGRIFITVGANANGAELRVEDDGPGIPEDKRTKIFERFFRLDPSRSRDSGGSGLGLAICREIVKAHGGEISVSQSPELGGAAFTVILPLVLK